MATNKILEDVVDDFIDGEIDKGPTEPIGAEVIDNPELDVDDIVGGEDDYDFDDELEDIEIDKTEEPLFDDETEDDIEDDYNNEFIDYASEDEYDSEEDDYRHIEDSCDPTVEDVTEF